jgi:hypothetical protein
MKDANGHGSNARNGAAHQSGINEIAFPTWRPSGFPVGGYYALDEDGNVLRGKAQYGDLPPRFKTPEQADKFALREYARRLRARG